MAQVLIECPTTKHPIYTGLDFDEHAWSSVSVRRNSIQCPHCPDMHTWEKRDAWLDGQLRVRSITSRPFRRTRTGSMATTTKVLGVNRIEPRRPREAAARRQTEWRASARRER